MTNPLPAHLAKASRNKPGHPGHWYTAIQKKFLQDNELLPRRELMYLFNNRFHTDLSIVNIKAYCTRHGMHCGQSGHFPKGHIPANKGQRGMVAPNTGQFPKGHVPANKKPVGHLRVDKDGYLLIRVPQLISEDALRRAGKKINNYRHAHVVKWEKFRGPVPSGFVLCFKTDDRTNIKFSNLELIPRSLLVRYNKNRANSYPLELRDTVKAYSQIQHHTGILKRKQKEASCPNP